MSETVIDQKLANFYFKLRRQFAGVDVIEGQAAHGSKNTSNGSLPTFDAPQDSLEREQVQELAVAK